MVVLHNSLKQGFDITGLQESGFLTSLSPELTNDYQKLFKDRRFTGMASSLPYGGKRLSIPDSRVSKFTIYSDFRQSIPVINKYTKLCVDRIPGYQSLFKAVLLDISGIDGKSVDDSVFSVDPYSQSDIYGLTTLRFLRMNRRSFNMSNDVIFAAMIARENFWFKSTMLDQTLVFANGYAPDPDLDIGVDSAVGIAQMHQMWWADIGKFLGVDNSEHMQHYYAVPTFPWWLQALLEIVKDMQLISRYDWMRVPVLDSRTKTDDPNAISTRYPYWLKAQPALKRTPLSKLYERTKSSDAFLKFDAPRSGFGDINMRSILIGDFLPSAPSSILFQEMDDAILWYELVAGMSNSDLASYFKKVDRTIFSKGKGPKRLVLSNAKNAEFIMRDYITSEAISLTDTQRLEMAKIENLSKRSDSRRINDDLAMFFTIEPLL